MRDGLMDGGVAFLMAAIGCLAAGRWAVPRLRQAGWTQPARYGDCPSLETLQAGKPGTPSMGGLFVLAAAAVAAAIAGGLAQPEGLIVVGGLCGVGAIGLADDMLKRHGDNARGLRSLPKLLLAFGVAATIAAWVMGSARLAMVRLPWSERMWEPGWLWAPLAVCVIAGSAHAVNLTDGMDGLAAGLLAMAFVAVGVVAALSPAGPDDAASRTVLIWSASLGGACAGFLWFNAPPASVFLGDVGALGLGAALGCLAILTRSPVTLVVIGGVFVAEAVSVMLQVGSFKLRKRRIFRVAPLHHHFQVGGMPEGRLVARMWLAGLALGILGVTSMVPAR